MMLARTLAAAALLISFCSNSAVGQSIIVERIEGSPDYLGPARLNPERIDSIYYEVREVPTLPNGDLGSAWVLSVAQHGNLPCVLRLPVEGLSSDPSSSQNPYLDIIPFSSVESTYAPEAFPPFIGGSSFSQPSFYVIDSLTTANSVTLEGEFESSYEAYDMFGNSFYFSDDTTLITQIGFCWKIGYMQSDLSISDNHTAVCAGVMYNTQSNTYIADNRVHGVINGLLKHTYYTFRMYVMSNKGVFYSPIRTTHTKALPAIGDGYEGGVVFETNYPYGAPFSSGTAPTPGTQTFSVFRYNNGPPATIWGTLSNSEYYDCIDSYPFPASDLNITACLAQLCEGEVGFPPAALVCSDLYATTGYPWSLASISDLQAVHTHFSDDVLINSLGSVFWSNEIGFPSWRTRVMNIQTGETGNEERTSVFRVGCVARY